MKIGRLQYLSQAQNINLPVSVSMSEKQQVAIKVQGISTPGGNSLMGQSQIGKTPRPHNPECLLLLLCPYMFAAAIFLCYLAW